MSVRTIAKITGWSLVAMAVIAGISLGYAYEEVFGAIQAGAVGDFMLFQVVLFGLLLTVILDFTVSFTLYRFFKNNNSVISLISMMLRIIYTLILIIAAFSLINSWDILNTDQIAVVANFERFMFIWTGGLIIFGFHLTLIGFLMKIHPGINKILWMLTIVAGVSYIIVHALKAVSLSSEQWVKSLEMILMLPMAAGELGLAIWLIVRGGKGPSTEKK
ncbi:MAG: DUF4386 domain-containing protein [Tannerella sp.]|jgi:hypothetical protein|nr:DUF4386 domain-containing protein [Tannerella sp.]